MRIEDFKKEKGYTTWYYSPDGDFEFIIKGNEIEPSVKSYELAKNLAPILDSCSGKAINLLESFMRDKGKWHLCKADFDEASEHKECVFTLEYGFQAHENRHEYSCTGFTVCFSWPLPNH